MEKFKKGDKFIPRKPKEDYEGICWSKYMDEYHGKTLTVEYLDNNGYIIAEETHFCFHPDWCEKVGNSENPNDHIPDVGKTIDWDYWRNEFAKSAMQGIFGDNNFLSTIVNKAETYKTDYKVLLCSTAIDIADEMIKQLKAE